MSVVIATAGASAASGFSSGGSVCGVVVFVVAGLALLYVGGRILSRIRSSCAARYTGGRRS